ncbi:MAG: hypothetical protein HQL07_16715 [Nitrospirae bacterium]|nr:hypothetical protein [Magnetococcales bacterium]
MSVLIVLDDRVAQGGAESCRFTPSLFESHRFTKVTGSGIIVPSDDPMIRAPVLFFWAATVFPGIVQSPCWEQRWPQGYLTALGLGLHPDPAVTWASVSLSHLRHLRDQLVFFHEAPPWIISPGAVALIDALRVPFADLGWAMHDSPGGAQVLLSTPMGCRAVVAPYETISGRSLHQVLPQGAGAGMLMQLLTTGQLVLAREEANRQREKQGLLALNTPWICGVGSGADFFDQAGAAVAVRGRFWCEDPEYSGLAHQAGWKPLDWETQKDNAVVDKNNELALGIARVVDAVGTGPVWIQFSPTTNQRLHHLLVDFIHPLATALAKTKAGLLILARETQGEVAGYSWGYGRGRTLVSKRRFWHRCRWGQGDGLTMDLARALWLS